MAPDGIDRYDYAKEAMNEMHKSPCTKRKVGAIVVDDFGEILGRGFNFNPNNPECEEGKLTHEDTVHAEIVAINDATNVMHKHLMRMSKPETMYVTHEPCLNCIRAIRAAGIKHVIVVDEGIKHDQEKLRLSLIPPQLIEGVGQVMTFGAKKYKKDNWKNLDNPERYLDALMRHLEAYRRGEEFDEETGLPHMAHLATNAGFLLWFDEERSDWREED